MSDNRTTVPTVSMSEALKLAAALVGEAGERDFHPTAAELKTQMLRKLPAFSEKQFGYRKFIDFLNAAEEQQLLFVFHDNNGHPRLSSAPVDEQPPVVISPELKQLKAPQMRLRSDLWNAIVHWNESSQRYWDRNERRAIYVPVDNKGAPLWESEPDRFTAITPIPMDEQVRWMKTFAESLDSDDRDALLGSMDSDAPRGAFKAALRTRGLGTRWGTELQNRVNLHVADWAKAHEVRADQIVDKRVLSSPRQESVSAGANIAASERDLGGVQSPENVAQTETEMLRSQLHRVIGEMSLTELAALQIPAIYLLGK